MCCVCYFHQLVDLTSGEREWLAEHLGHTLGVHQSHYRLQEPVIEMAQMSRLLIAVEDGKASEFVGKKLSDINPAGKSLLRNVVYRLIFVSVACIFNFIYSILEYSICIYMISSLSMYLGNANTVNFMY